MSRRTTRTEKLDLRLTHSAKQTLEAAASVTNGTLSAFVLESDLARADETFVDRRAFVLDAQTWQSFLTALDARPRSLPRMQRLLMEPGFFRTPTEDRWSSHEKLQSEQAIETFGCGGAGPNSFLQRFVLINQLNGTSQTYIGLVGRTVAGYHSLAFGQVTPAHTPERVTKGLSRHPIPIMLSARLAVDHAWQGQGIGSGLLKDAMLRTLNAADIAGIRALTVHAKDEKARAFYEHFDFIPSPSDPFHLFILLKDVRRIMA